MLARLVRDVSSVLSAVGCVVASTGCYRYQVIDPETVAPGSTVRATLSTQAMVRLEEIVGEARRTIEGKVVEADARQLLLLSRTHPTSPLGDGLGSTFLRQGVVIERQEIVGFEKRMLDAALRRLIP